MSGYGSAQAEEQYYRQEGSGAEGVRLSVLCLIPPLLLELSNRSLERRGNRQSYWYLAYGSVVLLLEYYGVHVG